MNRKLCAVVFFAAFFVLLAGPLEVRGGEPADIVFLIDTSVQMAVSDPDRVAVESVQRTIRGIDAGETRVGVVGFARLMDTIPLTALSNTQLVEAVAGLVLMFEYSGEEVSTGTALSLAAGMLGEDSSNPLVFLVTNDFARIDANAGAAAATLLGMGASLHIMDVSGSADELTSRMRGIISRHTGIELEEPEPATETEVETEAAAPETEPTLTAEPMPAHDPETEPVTEDPAPEEPVPEEPEPTPSPEPISEEMPAEYPDDTTVEVPEGEADDEVPDGEAEYDLPDEADEEVPDEAEYDLPGEAEYDLPDEADEEVPDDEADYDLSGEADDLPEETPAAPSNLIIFAIISAITAAFSVLLLVKAVI